jgi:hypothetical protein
MQNTEGGRKLNQAMVSTGRAVATTGRAVGEFQFLRAHTHMHTCMYTVLTLTNGYVGTANVISGVFILSFLFICPVYCYVSFLALLTSLNSIALSKCFISVISLSFSP